MSRLRFHRPVGFLPHQRRRRYIHAGQTGSSLDSFSLPCRPRLAIPAALRLPDNDCCAIHPPEALRAANRKSGIVMPEIQNPKSTPACPARYQDNSSPPDFYGNPTPLTCVGLCRPAEAFHAVSRHGIHRERSCLWRLLGDSGISDMALCVVERDPDRCPTGRRIAAILSRLARRSVANELEDFYA